MNLQEIKLLIDIKQYLLTAVDNYTIPKSDIKELNSMILLIDKKIISILTGTEFKEYINFEIADKVVRDAAMTNNILSKDVMERKYNEKHKFIIDPDIDELKHKTNGK